MAEGWIKLHRKTLECPVAMIDAEHLAIWIYLLLKATHKEIPMMFGNEKIMLKPGQLITGHTKIAADLKISRSKVQRVLNCFKNDMQIDTQTCSKGTLITVLSWDKYQIDDTQNDTEMIRNRYASDTQVSTNKNVKNEKNVKNISSKEDIKRFDNEELNSAFNDYIKHRKSLKSPMTDKAIELAVKNLNKLSGGDDDKAIKIIEQSIREGWKGLFELKEERSSYGNNRRNEDEVSTFEYDSYSLWK